jgi:hypothetical protein
MKRSLSIPLWLMAILAFLVSSCGSNETKTEEKTADSAAAATPATETTKPSTISTEPQNMMITTHKVKDFDAWLKSYESHDSLRLANGIHSYVIGREVKDPNMVLVAVKIDDVEKAKAFSKNSSLKQAMQKGGVIGVPKFRFTTIVFRDSAQIDTKVRSYTSLTVKDWDHWQKSFDSTRAVPTDNGLIVRAYGHDIDDNHKVVLVTAITDSAKASAYWKSDMLKQRRAASGAGEPTRFIYEQVKRY